ncbi:MAG: hypothetical protein SO135_04775 [Sphaerochaetaceae bacterium]|jgi:FtsH-binding integral membrane protein|nr:hypothetical protein [Sphaerochaetaceae bacterium]NLY08101.1 hypothetical protein [Spirochaetales bacterium]
MTVYEILEILMLISFGFAWPFNVIKSFKARTAKGKSLLFMVLVLVGYVCGILAKLFSPSFKWYVLFFYLLNFSMVMVDFFLYFRNRRLDKVRKKEI